MKLFKSLILSIFILGPIESHAIETSNDGPSMSVSEKLNAIDNAILNSANDHMLLPIVIGILSNATKSAESADSTEIDRLGEILEARNTESNPPAFLHRVRQIMGH